MTESSAALPVGDNTPPEKLNFGVLRAHDGINLRYAISTPPRGDSDATILFVTGRSEYIEKYFETIGELNAAGFAVAILDLRGQGGSERLSRDPLTGHIRRFSDFTDDIATFYNDIVSVRLPGPCFLAGHSLGGLIALSYASRHETPFDGIVLLAPFLGLKYRHLPEPFVRLVARCAATVGLSAVRAKPHAAPPAFEAQTLTTDKMRYDRNIRAAGPADLSYLLGAPSFGWLSQCLGEIGRLRRSENLRSVRPPVLMLIAGEDSLIPATAQHDIARSLKAEIAFLPQSAHDILQERDEIRTVAMDRIISFIRKTRSGI